MSEIRIITDKIIEIKFVKQRFTRHKIVKMIVSGSKGWSAEIPRSRFSEFGRLFEMSTSFADHSGYLNAMTGRFVRVALDDASKVNTIYHITKNISYNVI